MWGMNLATYLQSKGELQSTFARRVGTTPATISRLIKGEFPPSLALAAAIERETFGAVPMQSWTKAEGRAA